MSEKKAASLDKAILAGSGIVIVTLIIGLFIAQTKTTVAIRTRVAVILTGYLVACFIWNSAGRGKKLHRSCQHEKACPHPKTRTGLHSQHQNQRAIIITQRCLRELFCLRLV